MKQRHALLSVYNKDGITDFAAELVELGWSIWSSGGTAKTLTDAGVAVKDVAELTGGGAILGHRVVTLSREIHAGLLARDTKEDLAELKRLGVPYFDLVCVDLYPLADEIASPDATPESVVEKTDIGGPTMLRSAAKGRRIVICEPAQRHKVLDWLKAGESNSEAFRRDLAARVEYIVAGYALASARYRSDSRYDGLLGEVAAELKYGENAIQAPAHLLATASDYPLALHHFEVVAGSAPSYNNYWEIGRHVNTITHIAAGWEINFGKVPYIAVGTKHGNACGAAVAKTPSDAVRRMVTGDPRAIFGGLVMVNFEVDKAIATELAHHGVPDGQRRILDAVLAPSFTPEAIEVLERKGGRCRMLANPALASLGIGSLNIEPIYRQVPGGFLRQPNYTWVLDLASNEVTKTADLSDKRKQDLVLAWAICATSNSNTVTLVRELQLIGNGVGQQDRVSCCELAIKRARDAGHHTSGATAASDSFFPFPDGPETLAQAGISAIWATSGSVKDDEVRDTCLKHKVALWQVPDSIGRGFLH